MSIFNQFEKWFGDLVGNHLAGSIAVLVVALLLFFLRKPIANAFSRILYRAFRRLLDGVDRDTVVAKLQPAGAFVVLVIALGMLPIGIYHLVEALSSTVSGGEWTTSADFIKFQQALKDNAWIKDTATDSYLILLIGAFTWLILRAFDIAGMVLLHRASLTDTKQDDQIIQFGVEVGKIVLIVIILLFSVSNIFGVNISSLLAGLGIGGIALALAAKESLENLLGSFTIFFDKPFTVGDFVSVGGVSGVVEKVGFRSTRIRTLEKSYLTVPNKKMIDAELDNLSLRTFRRVDSNIGVLYSTSIEQIEGIVKDIQKYIDDHQHTNMDGEVRFISFGDSALNIRIVYFIDSMNWKLYLDIRQEINFEIMRIVERHGSGFAFPTQTIHLEQPN